MGSIGRLPEKERRRERRRLHQTKDRYKYNKKREKKVLDDNEDYT